MRKHLFILIALAICCTHLHAQFIYKIKADSVRIYNDNCTAELILQNSTKDTIGFLFNKGNGRTEFRRMLKKVNDSSYLIGNDTLRVSDRNSYSQVALINDTTFVLKRMNGTADTVAFSFGRAAIDTAMLAAYAKSADVVKYADTAAMFARYFNPGGSSANFILNQFSSAQTGASAWLGSNLRVGANTTLDGGLSVTGATQLSSLSVTGAVKIGYGAVTQPTNFSYNEVNTGTPTRGILSAQYSNNTNAAQFIGRKSRGTLAAPLKVAVADFGASLMADFYDGSGYVQSAGIRFTVDGSVLTATVPTSLTVYTGASGGGTPRLRTNSDGKTLVGRSLPSDTLNYDLIVGGYGEKVYGPLDANTLNGGYYGFTSGGSQYIGTLAAMPNSTSYQNLVIGNGGGASTLTTGFANLLVGSSWTGGSMTTGSNNTALGGYSALGSNTTGSNNTGVGQQALTGNVSGSFNVAVGSYTGHDALGDLNTFLGGYAGVGMLGSKNIVIGGSYPYNTGITTGNNNTIIGGQVNGLDAATSNNIILADGQGNIKYRWDGTSNNFAGTLTLGSIPSASSSANILVNDGGVVKSRTTAQLLSDVNAVPYTGAVSSLNMGANNISTSGALTAGNTNINGILYPTSVSFDPGGGGGSITGLWGNQSGDDYLRRYSASTVASWLSGNWLPLSAGSGNALSGDLYFNKTSPLIRFAGSNVSTSMNVYATGNKLYLTDNGATKGMDIDGSSGNINLYGTTYTSGGFYQAPTFSASGTNNAYFYNINSEGYGLFTQGGTNTKYAFSVNKYDGTNIMTVLGNGNTALAGNFTSTGMIGAGAAGFVTTGTTSGNVSIKSVSGTYDFTLPTSGGTNGYVLSTNGFGTTSWTDPSSFSGTSYFTRNSTAHIISPVVANDDLNIGSGRLTSGFLFTGAAAISGNINMQTSGHNTAGVGGGIYLTNAAGTDGLKLQLNASNDWDLFGRTSGTFATLPVVSISRAGAVTAVGSITAASFITSSDSTLKNISYKTKGWTIPAIEYTWKDERNKNVHYGVSAQDVQAAIPGAVAGDGNGKLLVNYAEANSYQIMELQNYVLELKKEIDMLKNLIKEKDNASDSSVYTNSDHKPGSKKSTGTSESGRRGGK